MLRRMFIVLGLSSLLLAACAPKESVSKANYYLVRHAEKTTEKPDPALTEAGQARAMALAERLKNVKLTAIYSSDYKRTRDTAAPTAQNQGLEVRIYDPRDLPALAEKLLEQDGKFLVVGHSNTTPELSSLLGGIKGEPIVEATEYNRFYNILRTGDQITSRIEPYGE